MGKPSPSSSTKKRASPSAGKRKRDGASKSKDDQKSGVNEKEDVKQDVREMLRHHQAVAASLAAVLADATASQAAAKPAGERQWGRMQALGNGLTAAPLALIGHSAVLSRQMSSLNPQGAVALKAFEMMKIWAWTLGTAAGPQRDAIVRAPATGIFTRNGQVLAPNRSVYIKSGDELLVCMGTRMTKTNSVVYMYQATDSAVASPTPGTAVKALPAPPGTVPDAPRGDASALKRKSPGGPSAAIGHTASSSTDKQSLQSRINEAQLAAIHAKAHASSRRQPNTATAQQGATPLTPADAAEEMPEVSVFESAIKLSVSAKKRLCDALVTFPVVHTIMQDFAAAPFLSGAPLHNDATQLRFHLYSTEGAVPVLQDALVELKSDLKKEVAAAQAADVLASLAASPIPKRSVASACLSDLTIIRAMLRPPKIDKVSSRSKRAKARASVSAAASPFQASGSPAALDQDMDLVPSKRTSRLRHASQVVAAAVADDEQQHQQLPAVDIAGPSDSGTLPQSDVIQLAASLPDASLPEVFSSGALEVDVVPSTGKTSLPPPAGSAELVGDEAVAVCMDVDSAAPAVEGTPVPPSPPGDATGAAEASLVAPGPSLSSLMRAAVVAQSAVAPGAADVAGAPAPAVATAAVVQDTSAPTNNATAALDGPTLVQAEVQAKAASPAADAANAMNPAVGDAAAQADSGSAIAATADALAEAVLASVAATTQTSEEASANASAIVLAAVNVDALPPMVVAAATKSATAPSSSPAPAAATAAATAAVAAAASTAAAEEEGSVSVETDDEPQSTRVKRYKALIRAHCLVEPEDIVADSLETFPYHLGTGTKERLISTAEMHLLFPDFTQYGGQTLGCLNPRVMLSGPPGSEMMQVALAKTLALKYNARLLIFDKQKMGLTGLASRQPVSGIASHPLDVNPLDDKGRLGSSDSSEGEDDGAEGSDEPARWGLPPKRRRTSSSQPRSTTDATRAHLLRASAELQIRASRLAGLYFAPGGVPAAGMPGRPQPEKKGMSKGDWVSYLDPNPGAAPAPKPSRPSTPAAALLMLAPPPRPSQSTAKPAGLATPGSRAVSFRLPEEAAKEAAAATAADDAPARATDATEISLESRGPACGACGRVILTFDDNPLRVGVRFDEPVIGGYDLGGLCEPGHGFLMNTNTLTVLGSGKESRIDTAALSALMEVITEVGSDKSGPRLVVFIKEAGILVSGLAVRLDDIRTRMEELPGGVLTIVSHIGNARTSREGGGPGSGSMHPLLASFGSGSGAFPSSFPRSMSDFLSGMSSSRGEDGAASGSEGALAARAGKLLPKLCPNRINLVAPLDATAANKWRAMLERDASTLREAAHRRSLQEVFHSACNVHCPALETVPMRCPLLDQEAMERVAGWAVTHHLARNKAPVVKDGQLHVDAADVVAALGSLKTLEAESGSVKSFLKDIVTENDHEKRILSEVVAPEEMSTGFANIGALDNVKDLLREVIMLPLQRPELFLSGTLMKPAKGVLLFGPPGTGKTMLAKAVASESGANFLHISMATLTSKWFGEGEKIVKAAFAIAHRIAPCVIFVDEVDSMLGKRGTSSEHEATRKIKNEFMSCWDGLRTSETARVLVLAATNRPMDLDEAVIRRLPRRILVDLPDSVNRARILEIILKGENLCAGFKAEEVATMTDGYSGSDLRNLCTSAAYRPVRDFLAAEKAALAALVAANAAVATLAVSSSTPAASADGSSPGASASQKKTAIVVAVPTTAGNGSTALVAFDPSLEPTPPKLRAMTLADFKAAMLQVGPSVSNAEATMGELKAWNEMYGEGGNRRAQTLTYYM